MYVITKKLYSFSQNIRLRFRAETVCKIAQFFQIEFPSPSRGEASPENLELSNNVLRNTCM